MSNENNTTENTQTEKKPFDLFLRTNPKKGEEAETLGGMNIKAGKAAQTGNGYLFLEGYSKKYGSSLSISLTSRVPAIVKAMCDAGLGDKVAEILAQEGVIG